MMRHTAPRRFVQIALPSPAAAPLPQPRRGISARRCASWRTGDHALLDIDGDPCVVDVRAPAKLPGHVSPNGIVSLREATPFKDWSIYRDARRAYTPMSAASAKTFPRIACSSVDLRGPCKSGNSALNA
jgi:hypothetical protein